MPAANELLELGVEPVEVQFEGGAVEGGEGRTYLRMLPSPRIEVRVTFGEHFASGLALIGPSGSRVRAVAYPGRNASVPVERAGLSMGPDGTFLTAVFTGPLITGLGDALRRVEFLVMNFLDFLAPKEPGGTARFPAVHLEAGGWRITLRGTPTTSDVIRKLGEVGGYGITHQGEFARSDSASFTADDAHDMLTCLHYFLAFAAGQWAPPLLPIAVDAEESRVWEQWEMATTTRWTGRITWFERYTGNQLAEVFPGFLALWKSPHWSTKLREAVHWFVSSNKGDGGVEGSLVLSSTALELLAWAKLVELRQQKQKPRAHGTDTAGKLRALLIEMGIPTNVPVHLPELAALAGKENWDGPATLAGIRNGIVHPARNDPASNATDIERIEAWQLAQWYVELVLLRLCSHQGTYANRFDRKPWLGYVTKVPWA